LVIKYHDFRNYFGVFDVKEITSVEELLMQKLLYISILCVMIVSVGCQSTEIKLETPSGLIVTATITPLHDSNTQDISTPDRSHDFLQKTTEAIPPTPIMTPIKGEAPQTLLDSILKDLSESSGIAVEKISVYQAEAITWKDGSLGCPQPGMFYTQALVPGFRIILEIGDQKYDYHAAETGYFILCQRVLPFAFPEGTPDS
jgi:hypothetical protein